MNQRLGHIALLTTAILAISGLFAGSAIAAKNQTTVIEDPGRTLAADPAIRTASLDETAALGADTLKIAVIWRDYAPDGYSSTKPAGDLSDPLAYPVGVWDRLDEVVAGAQSRGLKVWLMMTAPAPRWAVSKESGKYIGNYMPSVTDYADFVAAVGKRYPSVTTFSFWNEPNIRRFMEPQTQSGIVKSAIHYRDMYRAAYTAIRNAGHANHTLLFGELMPRTPSKTDPNTSRPVAFLREFFCLDTKGRALKGKTATKHKCNNFKKISASGIAYHPYRLSGGPLDADPVSKDNAPINYLKRIYRVLDQAYKAKRLAKKNLKLYNSEFGFQSDPPDVFAGMPIKRIPAYLNNSEYLSWIDPRVSTYSQYQIVDDNDLSGFQTGLRFVDGSAKTDIYAAFQTPIVAMTTRSKNRVSIWGAMRAKPAGTTPVQIQYASGGDWKTAKTYPVSTKHGYFLTTIALSGAKSKTWRLVWSDGTSRTAKAVAPPKPRSD